MLRGRISQFPEDFAPTEGLETELHMRILRKPDATYEKEDGWSCDL
jgi:hypothetical protein